MDVESIFKIILIFEFSLFSIIRIRYYRLASKAGYRTVIEEDKRYPILLSLLICYEVLTFFIYIFLPQALKWAAISMPIWLRWLGVSIGILALPWFIWIHQSLGKNYSMRLRIKEQQTLVTDGPYRLIRHPMYTAFYMLHISAFFLTSNWFIGLTWILGLTIIVLLRVNREERMLLERFGEQYRSYMRRTGRFIPLLKFNKTPVE